MESAYYYLLEFVAFTKFVSNSIAKKGYNIPYANRKTISPKSLFGFV